MPPDLSHKQQEAMQHKTRMAILTFLQGYDKPATLGEVDEGIERNELSSTQYHLSELIEVRLVEKVPGTNAYRVVEG